MLKAPLHMMSHTRTVLLALSFFAYVSCVPFFAFAQDASELSVAPAVIDEKAKARDILKESITITNTTNRKLNLYPSVNDVDSLTGEEDFVSAQSAEDRAASLANWIELSRGVVELSPGEEKTIPFVIRVNLNALAGTYHAQITLAEGSTRSDAEKRDPLATLMVNLEVQADIKEVLQLNKFVTDNVFFSGDDVLFNYQLENLGNQDLEPTGEIRIYDRKGREVTSLDINGKGQLVAPEEISQMASVWSAVNGFGKYKAFLTIDYGNTQTASVQDTIYFWIVPWKQLLALFVGSLIAVIFFALYFHRWFERRHVHTLAAVGHAGAAPTVPEQKKAPEPAKESAPIRWTKSLLKIVQKGKKTSSVATMAPAAPTPSVPQAPQAEPVQPAPQPAPQVTPQSVSTPSRRGEEQVINLKNMKSNKVAASSAQVQVPQRIAPAPEMNGHVINLKKK